MNNMVKENVYKFEGLNFYMNKKGVIETVFVIFASAIIAGSLLAGSYVINSEEEFSGIQYQFWGKKDKVQFIAGSVMDQTFSSLIHLGFHSPVIRIIITMIATTPFRINGFEITFTPKGIR